MSQPIDPIDLPEFHIEELRKRSTRQAEIMISWSDGTEAYVTVSEKTADRIGRMIEDELGRKMNINT